MGECQIVPFYGMSTELALELTERMFVSGEHEQTRAHLVEAMHRVESWGCLAPPYSGSWGGSRLKSSLGQRLQALRFVLMGNAAQTRRLA